ncbi:lipoyl domain-containing protein [bacterium]|nr:lipoyl domain-containing protein [bacterium]
MGRIAIEVPDLGMQTEEIKFGLWLKAAGERITAGEDLFEVEADKATVVCEAPADGVLAELVVQDGPVRTGEVIGYLDAG